MVLSPFRRSRRFECNCVEQVLEDHRESARNVVAVRSSARRCRTSILHDLPTEMNYSSKQIIIVNCNLSSEPCICIMLNQRNERAMLCSSTYVSSVTYFNHPLPTSKNSDQFQAILTISCEIRKRVKKRPEKPCNIIAMFISDMLLPISFETAKRFNRTCI